MAEAGKHLSRRRQGAHLIGQEPGEAGAVCTFETAAGERFSLANPPMPAKQKVRVIVMLCCPMREHTHRDGAGMMIGELAIPLRRCR
jgi:hypothetical protein